MPKSKGRKLTKPRRLARSKKERASEPSPRIETPPKNPSPRHPSARSPSAPARPKQRRLRETLLENDAELLFQIVTYLPLVFGAWLTGGTAMPDPTAFSALVGVVITGHYVQLFVRGRLAHLNEQKFLRAAHVIGGVLIAAFSALTGSFAAAGVLICWWIFNAGLTQLPLDTPGRIALYCGALLAQIGSAAVLGAFSQYHHILPALGVLGLIPGMFLVAATVARKATVFEKRGWTRITMVKRKRKNDEVIRPGSLTRLFTLLLISGPAIPIALAPLGLLPETFLICAIPLYFMPTIASAFQEELGEDARIAVVCVKLSALAAVLAFVGAALVVIA